MARPLARWLHVSWRLVLAPLLGGSLQALCIQRDAGGTPQLHTGVLAQTNGLAMTADYGFTASMQATAATVLAWLQAWMLHPMDAPPLHGPSA